MKNPGSDEGCRRVAKAGGKGACRRLSSKHWKPSNCLIAEEEAQFKRVAKVRIRRELGVGGWTYDTEEGLKAVKSQERSYGLSY